MLTSMRAIELTGKTFGRLRVLERIPSVRKGGRLRVHWRCVCECGTVIVTTSQNLRASHTRSCGCLHIQHAQQLNLSHGQSSSSEYRIWAHMLQRCTNPNNKNYSFYGGRGITVCARWHDFALFYEDMGPRPSQKHSLDRFPDLNGNYCPTNCRWATSREQMVNMRRNHLVTFDGETHAVADWARRTGVGASTISYRLKVGMSVQEAFTVQTAHRIDGRMLSAYKETKPLVVWARQFGLKPGTLLARIDKLGWTIERALTQSLWRGKMHKQAS